MSTFWHGKSVFLTGHTGFKGGWLALWLQMLGAKVTGYALAPSTNPSLFHAAGVEGGLQSVIADIRDAARLTSAMRAAQPDVVFHLAAQPLVRASYREPVETFATNVMGTVNVLEAARGLDSVAGVVVITTDKCYENREWVYPYREVDALGGHDPYSASKACAELVTAAYRSSFAIPDGRPAIATARAGNVIGGGDWSEDRIVPDCIRALTRGESIAVRNPAAVRPWQHVLEPLAGYLALAEALLVNPGHYGRAWNFGPDNRSVLRVGQLVELLVQAWGQGAWHTPEQVAQPHEAHVLRLDISQSLEALPWRPIYDARTAIERTIDWYRQAQGADASAVGNLCRQQIAAYLAAATE